MFNLTSPARCCRFLYKNDWHLQNTSLFFSLSFSNAFYLSSVFSIAVQYLLFKLSLTTFFPNNTHSFHLLANHSFSCTNKPSTSHQQNHFPSDKMQYSSILLTGASLLASVSAHGLLSSPQPRLAGDAFVSYFSFLTGKKRLANILFFTRKLLAVPRFTTTKLQTHTETSRANCKLLPAKAITMRKHVIFGCARDSSSKTTQPSMCNHTLLDKSFL